MSVPVADATRRVPRVAPKPNVTRVIDTAVKAASRSKDATATRLGGDGREQEHRHSALPPIPCTRPTASAPTGVRT